MLPLRVIIDDPHGTRSFLSVLFVCDHFVQNGCTFLGVSSPIEPYKRDFVLSRFRPPRAPSPLEPRLAWLATTASLHPLAAISRMKQIATARPTPRHAVRKRLVPAGDPRAAGSASSPICRGRGLPLHPGRKRSGRDRQLARRLMRPDATSTLPSRLAPRRTPPRQI